MSQSPEELIEAMSTEELQELLVEMGVEATETQALSIKALVKQLGSLEAVLDVIASFTTDARRAA